MAHYLIAGASGLVGSKICQHLDNPENDVTLLSRRPLNRAYAHHFVKEIDLLNPQLPDAQSAQDAVLCALGTTLKKAGSKDAFRKVDLDMVIALAKAASVAGYQRFVVVSSLGTTPDTRNFYLQTKAQMEQAVADVGFAHLTIMRPSLLLGERAEFRVGEKAGELAGRLLSPLFVGAIRKYRPIQADTVARAMIQAAQDQQSSVQILESDAIERLARGQ